MNYKSQTYTFNRMLDGEDAVTYYIDSSLGETFLENQSFETTLTAHIYKGSKEIDLDGEFDYTWYLITPTGTETILGTEKSITVATQVLGGNGVYFEAKSSTATLDQSILGYMVLG